MIEGLPGRTMSTIVGQIEEMEEKIKKCEARLDDIDRGLRLWKISKEERENLKEEQELLINAVKDHEKELKSLRKENRKSMLVSLVILVLLYLAYSFLWQR